MCTLEIVYECNELLFLNVNIIFYVVLNVFTDLLKEYVLQVEILHRFDIIIMFSIKCLCMVTGVGVSF